MTSCTLLIHLSAFYAYAGELVSITCNQNSDPLEFNELQKKNNLQMVFKLRKRCSIFHIKEMQIKIMGYKFSLSRVAKIYKN